ncbi:helix-hairpin-helix domain-containing protein [Puerhibacterium sp. TATVAM-FAB25]|uniref:helix-hairpin-helix domain-containing protein n=1 Tax=Puerhibacterium sp. TATVAM-FAB25 TaxID=3093699 RepID=UPI00397CA6C4
MPPTPDVRPVGDLPDAIGRTAARALLDHGVTSLRQVAEHSAQELLALHGVGPKAVAVLRAALAEQGLGYRAP